MSAERLEAVGELFHRLLRHDPVQHSTRIALVLTGPSAPVQGLAEVPFGLPSSREQPPEAVPHTRMPTVPLSPSKGRRAVATPAPCTLAKDPGIACARFSVMWYHRWETGSCEPFWYGGCGGNANRFGSERDCVCACTQPGR
uniref:BPTI/Kunitz inhibitor domain-containing protein n=1 Tax=Strix occidentalis caurina TaxID=311401 RepID=A0A8D0EUU0_STROC